MRQYLSENEGASLDRLLVMQELICREGQEQLLSAFPEKFLNGKELLVVMLLMNMVKKNFVRLNLERISQAK